jgi:hypothetical protein
MQIDRDGYQTTTVETHIDISRYQHTAVFVTCIAVFTETVVLIHDAIENTSEWYLDTTTTGSVHGRKGGHIAMGRVCGSCVSFIDTGMTFSVMYKYGRAKIS